MNQPIDEMPAGTRNLSKCGTALWCNKHERLVENIISMPLHPTLKGIRMKICEDCFLEDIGGRDMVMAIPDKEEALETSSS